jgi:hypothetical protein
MRVDYFRFVYGLEPEDERSCTMHGVRAHRNRVTLEAKLLHIPISGI